MVAATVAATVADARAPLVRVRGLVKRYGNVTAVDGLDFDIRPGEAFGLLGPNGAGKTTTFKVFTTAVLRTAGEVSLFGLDPSRDSVALKSKVGVIGQEDTLDDDLNVINNLRIYGGFFGLSRSEVDRKAERLLAFMGLSEKRTARPFMLSGGMKRRLMIVRALLNDPQLLLLDEPTTGLDPQVRHQIWQALRRLKQQGLTILLTTHYMEEAAQLADRVGIMDHGTIVAVGTPRGLIEETLPPYVLEFGMIGQPEGWQVICARKGMLEQHGDRVYVFADDEAPLREAIVEANLGNAQTRPSSLEDVFLKRTGHALEEE